MEQLSAAGVAWSFAEAPRWRAQSIKLMVLQPFSIQKPWLRIRSSAIAAFA
jgi:hypothetical protein